MRFNNEQSKKSVDNLENHFDVRYMKLVQQNERRETETQTILTKLTNAVEAKCDLQQHFRDLEELRTGL